MKKAIKLTGLVVLGAIAVAALILLITNLIVVLSTKNDISCDSDGSDYECIIVLGCGIYDNKYPSPMMADRIDAAIRLYNKGVAPKILMSGDHRVDDYNEVAVMKEYAMQNGVPEEDILIDDLGLSTSDTMRRAKELFNINKAVVVTQKYHLYRALFIAKAYGIECCGVIADNYVFKEQFIYTTREIFARCKDFFLTLAN